MDLFCPVCGENWEFDSLHEEAKERYGISYYEEPDAQGYYYGSPYFTKIKNDEYSETEYQKVFAEVSKEFRVKGCKALTTAFGSQEHCSPKNADDDRDSVYGLTRAESASALYDILGDDLDGAAAMLDDMGF